MAATSSKPLPSSLHQLVHGTPFDTHRDLTSSTWREGAPSSSSFRQRAWPNTSEHGAGTDGDFGRFAQIPQTRWSTYGRDYAEGGASSMLRDARGSAKADGGDVMALLGGSSMTEQVHSDWEADLMEGQQKRAAHDLRMPTDPFASARSLASRDGKRQASTGQGGSYKGKEPAADYPRPSYTSGDISPVSSDLISSLSSLDLSSRTYLKSLLSLPPDEALEDYFSRGTYTDDVYGLPADVQRLFEKAQSGGDSSREEGRVKAVRRLGMVMKHLWNEEAVGASQPFTESKDWNAEAWSRGQNQQEDATLQQNGKGKVVEEQATRIDQQQESSSPYLLAHEQQMQRNLLASQSIHHSQPFSSCLAQPLSTAAETSYRTDFSSQLSREELPRAAEQSREAKCAEEDEEKQDLPPFSYFMQQKVDQLAHLGGRKPPTPPVDDEIAYITEEGRSH